MSKHTRLAAALLLCLVMILAAGAALAEPKVGLTLPDKAIHAGNDYSVTINATEPGFVTLTLAFNGSLVCKLTENTEVHTNDNVLIFSAIGPDGKYLTPGEYSITAYVVDQFGTASKKVAKKMTIKEAKATPTPDVTATPAPKKDSNKATAAPKKDAAKATPAPAKATPAPKKGAAKATAAPKKAAASGMTYQTGKATVGAEGYEIGVGVSDAAATAKGYWALTSASTDAQIWAAMQEPMIAVNVGENENAYIYNSVADNRKRLGTVSGTSQGLNVIAESGKWSLVEAFRVEDGAFVRGYIRTDKLRTVTPNPTYGFVIDKKAQTLIVYKDGTRIGSVPVSTGLPTTKYLHRETPAGEFITVTRRGTTEYYGTGYAKYTIRLGGGYHLSEIPTTKKGGSDYSMLEDSLGHKATRGNVVIARAASADGGINAKWIWELTDEQKRIRVFILDDKERSSVPVGE